MENYGSYFHISAPEKQIFLDFLTEVTGKQYIELSISADKVSFDNIYKLKVATLEDILESKRIAGSDKDLRDIIMIEKTIEEKCKIKSKKNNV